MHPSHVCLAAQKQVLLRTHQLELQHAEEAKARELQTRLNTASSSVQQTLANLQQSNASLQAANTQLEHQLREKTLELSALSGKLSQGSSALQTALDQKNAELAALRRDLTQGASASQAALESKSAEVAALKKELLQARQTCDETLALADALQQTMDSLIQNGQAQEEVIASLQARLHRAELDKEEMRAAHETEARRVREAVAEATAASDKPSTLEELQEQKIVELLAHIAALEALLRERTETVSRLSEQQLELAHELEKSKKVRRNEIGGGARGWPGDYGTAETEHTSM